MSGCGVGKSKGDGRTPRVAHHVDVRRDLVVVDEPALRVLLDVRHVAHAHLTRPASVFERLVVSEQQRQVRSGQVR